MTADDVKVMLREFIYLKKEYEIMNERYARLYQQVHSPKKGALGGMPPGSSFSKDRIGEQVARLDGMKTKLDTVAKTISEKKRYIEKNINRMKKLQEKELMVMRYIDDMSWMSISDILFGAEEDYSAATEVYLTRCYRIHRRALNSLANIISESKKQ